MISFKTTILKFGQQGEKTGWTYIEIPPQVCQKLMPENKKSFRVKGKLDDFEINSMALIPMGDGKFIMPLKAEIRKRIKKQKGATLQVQIDIDKPLIKASAELAECLTEEKNAKDFFENLPMSHRNYFITWIESAKTSGTKAKRIAEAINAFDKKMRFNEMMRAIKLKKEQFLK